MSTTDKFKKPQLIFGMLIGVGAFTGLMGFIDYPRLIDIIFVTFLLAIWLFTGGIHAKGMWERGQLNNFLKWSYAPLVFLVLLLDITFNLIFGTLFFREVPREWLFTNRVKRHIKTSRRRDLTVAMYWAGVLNSIDPGHVSEVDKLSDSIIRRL